MVSIGLLYVYFVLAFFSGCPTWGDGILVETRGCPDLYKEQKTFVSFYDPSGIEPHSNGRGQCAQFGTIQCWPGFRQPFYEDTGQDATYYYRQWVAKVDEKMVIFPQFEEPTCAISGTLTFREPVESGTCLKPTPTPQPTPTPGYCLGVQDVINFPSSGCITGLFFQGPCTRSAAFRSRCADPTGYEDWSCSCPDGTTMSPIVIDVDHSGFSMSDAAGGVVFDMLNDGVPLAISWTAAGSTNALLVLDRSGNGTIDNGTELFGDLTPQPMSSEANGFLALAEYDKSSNGGDGNGRIDSGDVIFSQLRLWQDANHNGISEANELRSLGALGITGIDLNYKASKRTDAFGNKFRYRAKIYDASGVHSDRWAWDVFVMVQ